MVYREQDGEGGATSPWEEVWKKSSHLLPRYNSTTADGERCRAQWPVEARSIAHSPCPASGKCTARRVGGIFLPRLGGGFGIRGDECPKRASRAEILRSNHDRRILVVTG